MQTIWNFFLLLVSITCYSDGRYLVGWSTITDQSLIDEYLKLSLSHISKEHNRDVSKLQANNIVCKTQLLNGLHIQLSFDLEQQKWVCSLYKSPVETIDLQYEKCLPTDDDNSPDQNQEAAPASNDNAQLSERKQDDNPNNNDEENDDEEDLNSTSDSNKTDIVQDNDKTSEQQADDGNDEENDDEDELNINADNDEEKVSENDQQGSEQNTGNDDAETNPEVPNENTNNENDNTNDGIDE